MALKVPQDPQGSLDVGVGQAAMVLVGCQDKLDPRVTEDLMVWLVYLERRDIVVNLAHLDLQDHQERTERGVMMEMSDPEDCQVNLDHEDCWDQKGLQAPLDLTVCQEWMDQLVPRAVWDLKVNQDHQASRETQVHRVFQVHRVPLVRQERRAH